MAHTKYKIGQPVTVKLLGIPTEAKIRAIVETPEGITLIVDFGHEQTASVHERDVVES